MTHDACEHQWLVKELETGDSAAVDRCMRCGVVSHAVKAVSTEADSSGGVERES